MNHQEVRRRAERAARALAELELSATTQADRRRVDVVRRGLRALDDEQAEVKATIDAVLDQNPEDRGNVQAMLREERQAWRALRRKSTNGDTPPVSSSGDRRVGR